MFFRVFVVNIFLLITIAFSNFEEKLNIEINDLCEEIHHHHKEELRKLKVVFIGGFLNEAVKVYFKDNITTLKNDFNLDENDITVLFPVSNRSIEENSNYLYSELLKIYNASKKPLLVITHSKASVETLLAILNYPILIESPIIDKFVAINGAFGGSPIANILSGESVPFINMEQVNKNFPGLFSLKKDYMVPLFEEKIKSKDASFLSLLKNKVYYVRSQEEPIDTVFYMAAMNYYMVKNFGVNDGLMITEDQYISSVGTDLGVLNHFDHADLVTPRPYSAKKPELRRAFTRALIKYLY